MPPACRPARLPAMQVRHVLAQPRDHVAYVRGARAFGGEAFLERGNLVNEVGQRAAGVGLRRLQFLVVGRGRVGARPVRGGRVTPVREHTFALRLGPQAGQPCP